MAQVSPQMSFPAMLPLGDDSMGSDVFAHQPRTPITPESLPDFVFPFQAPRSLPENPSPTITSSNSNDTLSSRRGATRTRPPQRISINAPPFEFHPSPADTTPTSSGSHSHSPAKSLPMPQRTGGHRRGGSEYIGGDGTTTGPGLMSSSPTKGDGSLPFVSNPHRGPPGVRRGHAHRRSGAISSHDVSNIIRPSIDPSSPRSGSAPASPSDPDAHRELPPLMPALDQSAIQQYNAQPESSPPRSLARRDSVPNNGSRPRVGFSETVEFIPRPLSTISSETSSSLSTVRASHSVTGSITSIINGGSVSPSPAVSNVIREDPREYSAGRARPKSAGCILDDIQGKRTPFRRAISEQEPSPSADAINVSPTEESTISWPKRRGNATSSARIEDLAAQFSGAFLNNDPNQAVQHQPSDNIRRLRGEPTVAEVSISRPRSSPEPKVSKRQKKVKSWAESILSRKGKSPKLNDEPETETELPTSCNLQEFAPMDDLALEDINFDEDSTFTIRDPKYIPSMPTRTEPSTWESRSAQIADAQSPIIDLDAAFASLNTPGSGDSGDLTNQGGFSSAKRRMHSGGVMGGFTGPGMHYHRRAESAPEMVPIDYGSFGLRHLNSKNSMADVFEEDEEDEAVARAGEAKPKNDELQGLGVQIVDAENGSSRVLWRGSPKDQGRSINVQNPVIGQEVQTPSSVTNNSPDIATAVDIVDPSDEPRFSVTTKSSDESTITPKLTIESERRHSLPISSCYNSPRPSQYLETPGTPSSISSPDFAHTSFDVPRLHTATSSITDRTTWSGSRAGGAGQGSTYSTEDVPSLTSSASTMISSYPPRLSSGAATQSSGERSASFSGAVPPRTRPVSAGKRASLASLSRLVSSSYGERSKLSTEYRAQSDETDKADKKKGNRISRLMRFWKSKEKQVPS